VPDESKSAPAVGVPKYRQILEDLRGDILSGSHREGDRLPSETELGDIYSVSRLTVQRALKELQVEGLVDRRAGSGTYVLPRKQMKGHLFGLLIPGLGDTEIFEPICQGMAKAGRSGGHSLLWGGDTTDADETPLAHAKHLFSEFLDRRVSGIFVAPVEGISDMATVNQSIMEMLASSHIPLVLLDRCFCPYPYRSPFDLVGIDNRRAGFRVAQHLIERGAHRPAFLAHTCSAPTVNARMAGFQDAAIANGCDPDRVFLCAKVDKTCAGQLMDSLNPDGIVCANDATAVELMSSLEALGIGVPDPVRIGGIDDIRYASHLRVPLTTLRQPCHAIGEVAIQTMLSRIAQPNMPARDIYLDCALVVRQSCGAPSPSAGGSR